MKFLIVCIFLIHTIIAQGQENYVFSEINTNNGLSENNVRDITQLPDGRMIFKTEGLTNIYNGTSFHYIHVDDRKTYPLSNYTGFHRTYIDTKGNVWIKNRHELILIDMLTETFVPNLDSIFKVIGIREQVTDFFIDSEKNIWCLTDNNKLILRDEKTQITSVFLPHIPFYNKTTDLLYEIATVNNKVYLFYRSGIMLCYDKASKKELFRDNPVEKELPENYTYTLLVVKHENYLYQIRNGYNKGIIHRYNIVNYKWEEVLKTNYWLNTLTVNGNNEIFVSCKEGLWHISENLQKKNNFPSLQLVDGKILHSEISVVFNDSQEGLWIGTLNRGLLYYHPERFKFRNIGRTLFNINSEEDLKVNSFTELNSSTLICTDQGLYSYTIDGSKLKPFKKLPENNYYTCLFSDNENRLWFGTANHTLFSLEKDNVRKHKLPVKVINNIYELEPDHFILSTSEGLVNFDANSEKFTRINNDYPGFSSVDQIVRLKKNSFLGISNVGLFIYDAARNKFTLSDSKEVIEKYAIFKQKNNQINCVFADSRGLVWCATQDGLSIWNTNNNKIKYLYTKDGLVNNNIQSVIEEKNGDIWLATSNGITSVTVKEEEGQYNYSFTNYNRFDGVVDYEFVERSVFKSRDGKIFWGGLDGFNWIDINTFKENNRLLTKPVFVGISMFGKEINQGAEYNRRVILHQSIAKTKEILLKYNQNFITLDFSALNYINPTQTHYKFMLEGVDEKWNIEHAKDGLGHASYTDLSPGSYLFKVYAANSSKKWGETFAQIKIVIAPPFWATSLAYVLYVILFILVVYSLISYYLKRSKLKLEEAQEKQLNNLKFSFFTNVSHELRTPLTLIITPLEAILKRVENEKLKSQLSGIHKNARNLLNLVNQLLDFRRLEISGESLNRSNINIKNLVGDACITFEELAQSKNITLSYKCKLTKYYVSVDKDKLWKIINNLLSNALKFTPPKGHISIVLNKQFSEPDQKDILILEVSDTGIGIPKEEASKIFDRFYQTKANGIDRTGSGVGLHLTKEYIKLHNGTIDVNSNGNKGTVFTVKLPLITLDKDNIKSLTQKTTSTFKIAIIEDNDEFREFLCNQLEEIYEVISSSNGKDGLTLIREQIPDLVISDIMMPKMTGIELCKRLKNDIQISHIPLILLTARFSEDAQLEGFEAKADAYITKPFNMDILLQRIQNLLELQKQRHELYKKAVVIHPKSITSTTIDEKLIHKAIEIIEKNISNPGYNVEQFGRDMAMDRTGLYRKLLAIAGQTPSAFIRSVRLKHAARLLEQGKNVSEVSAMVGFGTIGYFGKCFQEEFKVKPSEYMKSKH